MLPRILLGAISLGCMFASPDRVFAQDPPLPSTGSTLVAARGGLLPVLYASYVALQVFDGYTTTVGVKHGAVESNGMMQGIADRPAILWTVKGGVTVAAIYTAERLWRDHRRKQAIAVMALSNGIMAAVAARNASVLHGRP
jgi:hypothetical protein